MSLNWNFIDQGYYLKSADGKKTDNIYPNLIDESARSFGRWFAEKGKPSSSQLRAFYADAKTLETKMRGTKVSIDSKSFEKHEYLIRMLKAKVAYAYGKETGKFVSKEFRDFINKCIDAIEDERDFEAFMKFFESTVGFYYGRTGELEEEKKKKNWAGRQQRQ